MAQVKDLSARRALTLVAEHGSWAAYEALCEEFPWKIVQRRWERLVAAGLMDCGVSARAGWITGKGRAYLAEHGEED
jgi:hypothetical protein